MQHADGVAIVGGDRAYITLRSASLSTAWRSRTTCEERTARAIAVLAHEAWHLRGESDEGTTECYALQTGVELGRRLGLDEGTARRMMAQQLAENTLEVSRASTTACQGMSRRRTLDLDPDRSSFP